MPDIYHIVNFVALIVAIIVGWKKLSPKNYGTEIKEIQIQVKDLEKSIDRIEAAVEGVRNYLLNKGNK